MIIREDFEKDGRTLVKTYSDKKVYIQNAQGVKYTQAIDPKEFEDVRVYTETDEPIPEKKEEPKTDAPAEAE